MRDMAHPLIWRKIKALYDSGWHIGTISWFNEAQELRVEYPDESEDYIRLDELNDNNEIISLH